MLSVILVFLMRILTHVMTSKILCWWGALLPLYCASRTKSGLRSQPEEEGQEKSKDPESKASY